MTTQTHVAAEHRVLVELLRALQKALGRAETDRSACSSLLKQLLDYSEAHFLSEQLLMRFHGYPAYEEHVLEHDRLIGDLRDLSVAWTEGGGDAAGNLLERVEEWLLTHMSTADMALEGYLAQHAPRPS